MPNNADRPEGAEPPATPESGGTPEQTGSRSPSDAEDAPDRRRLWIAFGALLLLLYASTLVELPVFSRISGYLEKAVLPTTGYIYVESPEVYTRERLVNDRYDQDYWLKQQLRRTQPKLGPDGEVEPAPLISVIEDRGTAIGIAPDGAETPDIAVAGPVYGDRRLDLRSEFDVQASVRDMIRQSVLENSLDDRHDLTGNTIYGLKFDTAVIPGSHTYRNPVVLISIDVDPFSPRIPRTLKDGSVQGRVPIEDFYSNVFYRPIDIWNKTEDEIFDGITRQFEGWRNNIEHNLNDYINWVCGNESFGDIKRILAAGPGGGDAGTKADKDTALFAPEETPLTAAFPVGADPAPELEDGPPPSAAIAGELAGDLSLLSVRQYEEAQAKVFRAFEYLLGVDRGALEFPVYELQPGAPQFYSTPYLDFLFRVRSEISRYFRFAMDFGAPDADGCPLPSIRVERATRDMYVSIGKLESSPFIGLDMDQVYPDPATGQTYGGDIFLYSFSVPGEADLEELRQLRRTFQDRRLVLELVRIAKDGSWKNRPINATDISYRCVHTEIPEGGEQALAGPATTIIGCADSVAGDGELIAASFDTGLFEFLRTVHSAEAYAYAVFPKADVAGVIESDNNAVNGSGGPVGFSSRLSRQESRSAISVINFATGGSSDVKFDFGWAFIEPGAQKPRQLSQTVLVSVPAFLEELNLTVRTGWLDRDGSDTMIDRISTSDPDAIHAAFASALSGYRELEMTVPLPPDYEALSSLIDSGDAQRRPRISPYRIGCGDVKGTEAVPVRIVDLYCGMTVQAGEPAKFVIEGVRLWRSTVVTLNGQTASRIQVLPDMRGIVASFDKVDPPYSKNGKPVRGLLKIWTSEGSVDSDITVSIAPVPEGKSQAAAAPQP